MLGRGSIPGMPQLGIKAPTSYSATQHLISNVANQAGRMSAGGHTYRGQMPRMPGGKGQQNHPQTSAVLPIVTPLWGMSFFKKSRGVGWRPEGLLRARELAGGFPGLQEAFRRPKTRCDNCQPPEFLRNGPISREGRQAWTGGWLPPEDFRPPEGHIRK